MSDWFTKKKDPPLKPGKTVGETFKNIAETYYDYGYITPKVVDFFKKKKKKSNLKHEGIWYEAPTSYNKTNKNIKKK